MYVCTFIYMCIHESIYIYIWEDLKTAYPKRDILAPNRIFKFAINPVRIAIWKKKKKNIPFWDMTSRSYLEINARLLHRLDTVNQINKNFRWRIWSFFLDCTSMLSTALPYSRLHFLILDCTSLLSTAHPYSRLHFHGLDLLISAVESMEVQSRVRMCSRE